MTTLQATRCEAKLPQWLSVAAVAAGAAGVGAAVMYLMDPERGRSRRSRLSAQARACVRETVSSLSKTLRDIEHRAEGTVAELRRRVEPEHAVSDRRLEARVHTKLGRVASNAHSIRVMSLSGDVVLGGTAPAGEIGPIIAAVRDIPGVRTVENRLKQAASIPA